MSTHEEFHINYWTEPMQHDSISPRQKRLPQVTGRRGPQRCKERWEGRSPHRWDVRMSTAQIRAQPTQHEDWFLSLGFKRSNSTRRCLPHLGWPRERPQVSGS
ncbi:unnamed protein product [Pleuronectes platessa]|uniref:Uncharacterized protein n=1 Tax=Pleuronectes platessa TaxID=8262 RepID=A0A9N7TW59_PLEPL|nr:unnamed protein product [Pleuronectes platessa]